MDQINFINATRITTFTFDNLSPTPSTQQMASNIPFKGKLSIPFSNRTLSVVGKNLCFEGGKPCVSTNLVGFCLLTLLSLGLFLGLICIYVCIKVVQIEVLLLPKMRCDDKLKKISKKVDKIDLKIQMRDMEIKITSMEMKLDVLEGKVDEKLTQERLDRQAEMLDLKVQAQKEKDDLQVDVPKIQAKRDRLEKRLRTHTLYKPPSEN
ncbi:hypothetical protein EAE96_002663 [Botrytis aclada]|nr:hypothetical protein EAE96_002663 [Botrytis aclada]